MFLVNSRQGSLAAAQTHHAMRDTPEPSTSNLEPGKIINIILGTRFEVLGSKHHTQCDALGRPYCKLTAAILPSSLRTSHSFALVFST